MPVAPCIVNDVSYATRINVMRVIFRGRHTAFGEVGG